MDSPDKISDDLLHETILWAEEMQHESLLSALTELQSLRAFEPQQEEAVAANKAEAIIRQVRKTLAAEFKHASYPPGSTETSRDEADFQYAELTDFTLRDCDEALAVVRRRRAQPAPVQVQESQTVSEEMVERAWTAFDAKAGYSRGERLRAALTAALEPSHVKG